MNEDQMQDEVEKILEEVDQASGPERMSAFEAFEFLGRIQGDLQMREEALREENEPESGEW